MKTVEMEIIGPKIVIHCYIILAERLTKEAVVKVNAILCREEHNQLS